MREQLVALASLAEIDAKARSYDVELEELPSRIDAMRSDVSLLETLLSKERAQLSEASDLKESRTAELKQRSDDLTRAKAKAAKARNLREMDAAEREVESARRGVRECEDEILSLEETAEKKSASLAEREKQFEEARALFAEEEQKVKERLAEVSAEREKVIAGRDDLAAKVPENMMRRYERVRKMRGVGLQLIRGSTCTGCRMALPPQVVIEAQRGNTLTQCPQCQVIVVHPSIL